MAGAALSDEEGVGRSAEEDAAASHKEGDGAERDGNKDSEGRTEAEELLGNAWRHRTEARSSGEGWSGATVAHRMALHELGKLLYGTWLLPFEAVSLLLLVAIVGAVVVAKPRI